MHLVGSFIICGGWHVSLVIKWFWSCSLLKGKLTSRRGSEREHEGKRWLWWRQMRCKIKVREIKSVSRWRDVFILRNAVVWSRGCVAREKRLRCQSISKTVWTLSPVLFSLIYKRDWKLICIFLMQSMIGLWVILGKVIGSGLHILWTFSEHCVF